MTRTARLAILLLALAVLAAVALAGFIAKVLHASITANIIKLKGTASELESGNLKARAKITSMDELGQFADTFNNMAAQLDTLIHNLEEKVAERTAELTEANRIISKHRDRMQEELNVGREIQMSMIPLTFPPFPEREGLAKSTKPLSFFSRVASSRQPRFCSRSSAATIAPPLPTKRRTTPSRPQQRGHAPASTRKPPSSTRTQAVPEKPR